MNGAQKNLRVEDDGLLCPEVGSWAETKYRLISLYDELFATGMKNKWHQRVYIDLYAGAGHSLVRGTDIRLKGSPILALSLPYPFNKYIFCEADNERLDALRKRTAKIAPSANVTFITESCDSAVETILATIPKGSSTNRVLSLCLVDPFDFGIKFDTIRKLSSVYIDFLVLLAVGMDANRAYEHYVEGNNVKIDEALGNIEWRERWKTYTKRNEFRQFLASEFAMSMKSLGYQDVPLHRMLNVRNTEKNSPLYYIALFSKSKTAYTFWDQVLKYHTDQTSFTWE
jgi:three-Cys-motif partner protein